VQPSRRVLGVDSQTAAGWLAAAAVCCARLRDTISDQTLCKLSRCSARSASQHLRVDGIATE